MGHVRDDFGGADWRWRWRRPRARRRIWSCRGAGGRRPGRPGRRCRRQPARDSAGAAAKVAGNWRCTSSMIFCSRPAAKPGGAVVVDHRAAALVAAFLQDALGGDVAGHVVGVGVDPQPAAVELLLQPQRVIDDDFAGQEDHRQLVAEGPGLDRVGECRLKFLAAVEPGELDAGVVADGVLAAASGLFLPLLARRVACRTAARSGPSFVVRGRGDRRERLAEQAARLPWRSLPPCAAATSTLSPVTPRLGFASAPQPIDVSAIAPG